LCKCGRSAIPQLGGFSVRKHQEILIEDGKEAERTRRKG
jgi:hypothetical protein